MEKRLNDVDYKASKNTSYLKMMKQLFEMYNLNFANIYTDPKLYDYNSSVYHRFYKSDVNNHFIFFYDWCSKNESRVIELIDKTYSEIETPVDRFNFLQVFEIRARGFIKSSIFENYMDEQIIDYFDADYINELINRHQFPLAANIFMSPKGNEKLKETKRSSFYSGYYYQEGYSIRNIAEVMKLPEDITKKIDAKEKISQDQRIDTFNEIFCDACSEEKWASKITRLTIKQPRLNQDNLLSFIISIYETGGPFDEENEKYNMMYYYKLLKQCIKEEGLVIYDYENETLNNLKNVFNLNNYEGSITEYLLETFNVENKSLDYIKTYIEIIVYLQDYYGTLNKGKALIKK